MNNQLKKRIGWVDAAKGIGIILVIFAHLNTGVIGKWIYSFHVPLFFILSGYVFNADCDIKTFAKKKLKSIVIPYFCLGLVMMLFQIIRNCVEGHFSVHSSLVIGVELCIQIRYWTLWYIACLLCLNIQFFLLHKVIKNDMIVGVVTLIISWGGVLYAKADYPFLPWNLDACWQASLFFELGCLFKKNYSRIYRVVKKKSVICFTVALLLNIGAYLINLQLCGEALEMNQSQYGIAPLTFLAAVSGSIAVMIAAHWLDQLRCLIYIGQNSLLYYAWHQQIFIVLLRMLSDAFGIQRTGFSLPISQFAVDLLQTLVIILAMTLVNKVILKSKLKFMLGA